MLSQTHSKVCLLGDSRSCLVDSQYGLQSMPVVTWRSQRRMVGDEWPIVVVVICWEMNQELLTFKAQSSTGLHVQLMHGFLPRET